MHLYRRTNDLRAELFVGHTPILCASYTKSTILCVLNTSGLCIAAVSRRLNDRRLLTLCVLSASPLCVAAFYFTSASFPFSMLITAISLGSTPFFSAQ